MIYVLVILLSLLGIYWNCKLIYSLRKTTSLPGSSRVYLYNMSFASLCYCTGALLSFMTSQTPLYFLWSYLPINSEGTYCYIWFILEVLGVIVEGISLLIFTVDRLKSADQCKPVVNLAWSPALCTAAIIWLSSVLLVAGSVLSLKVDTEVYELLSVRARCEVTHVVNTEWLGLIVVILGCSFMVTASLFGGLYKKVTVDVAQSQTDCCEHHTFTSRFNWWLEYSLVQLALPFCLLHALSWIPIIGVSLWHQGSIASHPGRGTFDMSKLNTVISMPFLASATFAPLFSLYYTKTHAVYAKIVSMTHYIMK